MNTGNTLFAVRTKQNKRHHSVSASILATASRGTFGQAEGRVMSSSALVSGITTESTAEVVLFLPPR